ncbi:MAG TPA: hypothetical protein VK116_15965, partial [Planctomycetota bacterium]|nr:hypothetical protein [Planctomycetota bacterium]
GEAAWEFGRESGAAFERAQGGVFSSPRVGAIVDALRAEGIRGVGQSSWGPAVWAWAAGEEEALAIARAIVDRLELRPREVRVTRALESGAELVDERPERRIVPDDEDEGV